MDELELIKEVVKKAGKEILKYYNKNNKILNKNDYTPLTDMDLASEEIILSELKQSDYGILSEHANNRARLNKKRVWIIDPLDGTLDFIQKTGEFSIMIGLVENGKPILGAVYQPTEDKIYFAQKNKGAYLQVKRDYPIRLRVSSKSDLKTMSILVSRNHLLQTEKNFCENVGIKKIIPCGSSGLKTCLITEQKADLYLNTSNKTGEWDICAGDIIINEAGGKLTDLNGEKIIYNKKRPINMNGFVVSNGQVHKNIITELVKIRKV